MKYNIKVGITLFLLLSVIYSGCLDIFNDISNSTTIIYEDHPIHVEYQITYGYFINLTGEGKSILSYKEDYPDVLNGKISYIVIHNQLSAKNITIAHNPMIFWHETLYDEMNLSLGISATINANSMLITYLNQTTSLTIQQIAKLHPTIVQQYCRIQGNETEKTIDPTHPFIINTANKIKNDSGTDNVFELVKNIFIWLKTNTEYDLHYGSQETQSSINTFLCKTGDCDDLSFLYIALCRSLNIPARFIRGYLLDRDSDPITLIPHVWVEVFVGNDIGSNGWIPVECAGTAEITAEIHQNFAVEDVDHLRLFIDDGTNTSLNTSSSHISIEYEKDITINLTHFATINEYNIITSKNLCVKENTNRYYS